MSKGVKYYLFAFGALAGVGLLSQSFIAGLVAFFGVYALGLLYDRDWETN